MEFIVLRDGELWTDGFCFKEDAIKHMEESERKFDGVFEVLEVADKELDSYYKKDEAIKPLEDYSYIFDLQSELIKHNITYKLHSKRIIEINNVQGNIFDIITKIYDNYYSHSSVYCENQIPQMYIIDEGGGLCTIIIPQSK